jgi:Rieske Fe-S protein
MSMSRREALKAGWKVGGGLLVVAAGWTSVEALRPLAADEGGGLIKLGAGDFAEGTATFIREGRCYVTNVQGQLFALSQQCPHLGCRVPYCESSGQFECPCHGSVFDAAGEWLSGPSPRGLDRFEIREAPGGLVVDVTRKIEGPPPGTRVFYTPPRGPGCGTEG